MLLLTSDMQVKALCQEIRPAPPVLPPETATIPGPQTWYSLSSYRFCGAWQYDVYDGSQLKDMSVDPATRFAAICDYLSVFYRLSVLLGVKPELMDSAR